MLLSAALLSGCRSPVRVQAPSFEEVSKSPETSAAAVADCDFTAVVADDDLPGAKALLDRGCNPNQGQPGTDSPLYSAVWNSQKDMARLLLEGGADPNATNLLVRRS